MKELTLDAAQACRVTKTEEGYLTGRAKIARVGIQAYRIGDRSWNDYRPASEVFAKDAVASFQNKPVTFGHPREMVDASNAKELAIGFISDSVEIDGNWIVAPITITDAEAIAKIEKRAGKGKPIELSAGYWVNREDAPGVFDGIKYQQVQRNIRANHVAIVDAGRAGAEASLTLDAAQEVPISTSAADPVSDASEENILKTIVLDGVSYDVPPEVARHMEKSDEARDAVQAKFDAISDELEKLRADTTEEKLRQRIAARVELERKAAAVTDAALNTMSDMQIKRHVAEKLGAPSLEGKSDAYIEARFDLAIEAYDAAQAKKNEQQVNDAQDGAAAGKSLDAKWDEAYAKVRTAHLRGAK